MAQQINLQADTVYQLDLKISGKAVAALMAELNKMPYGDVCETIMQVNTQLIELTNEPIKQE